MKIKILKKSNSLRAFILSFVFISSISSTGVHAATRTVDNLDTLINQAQKDMRKQALTEYKNTLRISLPINDNNINSMTTYYPTKNNLIYSNFKAEPIGNPNIIDPEMVCVNTSIFENSRDVSQSFSTNKISFTDTNSVTTTATQQMGTSITSTFKIPIGELGTTIQASYNYSDSKANTTTTTVTHELSPIHVEVKPHSKVEVSTYLKKYKVQGKLLMTGTVNGTVNGKAIITNLRPNINTAIERKVEIGDVAKALGYETNADNSINIQGTGSYEASIGTTLVVVVKDLTTNEITTSNININK